MRLSDCQKHCRQTRNDLPPTPGDVLQELVSRVCRLCPDHRDPHRFHEEKSEIAHELVKLARRVA